MGVMRNGADDLENGDVKLPLNGANPVAGVPSSPRGGIRRAHSTRIAPGSRLASPIDDSDLEDSEKNSRKSRHQAVVSGLAYCASSCSMILLNKYLLSGYNFNAGISLMFYQNLVSVVAVGILSCVGAITIEPITWKLVRVWFPVNVLFVGMLVSSIYSLKNMNVAMVTILKNMTNLVTALGDMYLFGKHHNRKVWGSLFLMVLSAVAGGVTDVTFHGVGYAWQILNCFLTAAYSLTLRKVMDTAKQATKSGNLGEFSMVLLNNSLSLPLGLVLILSFNEIEYLATLPILRLPTFWFVITLSGLFGLAISFTSMWFLYQTSATTYSLVGSLNKIPLSIAGIVLFRVSTSLPNMLSIIFGLFAGVVFAKAKMSKTKVDNYVLDVILGVLEVSKSDRLREICMGILGNLAFHEKSGKKIADDHRLLPIVVQQLYVSDAQTLAETCRVISVGLHGKEAQRWIEALNTQESLERLLWITENTLNDQLTERVMELLLTMVDSDKQTAAAFLPGLIDAGLVKMLANLASVQVDGITKGNILTGDRFDSLLQIALEVSLSNQFSGLLGDQKELKAAIFQAVRLAGKDEIGASAVTAMVLLANLLPHRPPLAQEIREDAVLVERLVSLKFVIVDDNTASSALSSIIKAIDFE